MARAAAQAGARSPATGFRFARPSLRRHREGQGLSLNQLAREAQISPGTLSRIERQQLRVSPKRQEVLAACLDLGVDELFKPLERGPLDARNREIAAAYTDGMRMNELTKRYGLDRSVLGRIIDRQGVRRSRGLGVAAVAMIVERYERGDSAPRIAEDLRVSTNTVYFHLKRRGVARRPSNVPWKHPAPSPRACETCGTEFTPTGYQVAHGGGTFCSRACARAAKRVAEPEERTCAYKGCGMTFTPWPSEAARPGRGQFCSARCRQLHFWRTGQVEGFEASLSERGLFGGRARQRWGGRRAATKPPGPGARVRGRPRLQLPVETLNEIHRRAALGHGRATIARDLELPEHRVRTVLSQLRAA